MTSIWEPIELGGLGLSNRFAMAPMTRSRAMADGTPGALAAEYYGQRATVGLVISEGTQPSGDGQGYLTTPGIHTDAHVAGWRDVVSAVHARGSRMFIQLMHVGRVSHPDNTPHHRQPVAPSAIAPRAQMFTANGMRDIPEPRALDIDEIGGTIRDFRLAARRAVEAGADGVEIHGANSYLVHQFLAPNANTRTDRYGGSIENRARFALELAEGVAAEIGAERTAMRISPGMSMNDIDEGPEGPDLYRHLVAGLDGLGLAYLHVMHLGNEALLADIRRLWTRVLIVNRPGRARDRVGADVQAGLADMEAYGSVILANPDFLHRLKRDAPLNEADRSTFYGGGARGYTDYPVL